MDQEKINAFFGIGKYTKKEESEDNPVYTMFFDGCSKGNPGIAGAGASICSDEKEIWFQTIFVGDRETNNVAEYNGLVLGLGEAVRRNIKELVVKGDSELIIKQMRGEYKVSSSKLQGLHKTAKQLSDIFHKITFIHIYRHFNKRADELANKAIS